MKTIHEIEHFDWPSMRNEIRREGVLPSFSGPKKGVQLAIGFVLGIALGLGLVWALVANAGEGECGKIRRVYLESSALPSYAEVAKCRDMGVNVLQ